MDEIFYMHRCLQLARLGAGYTAPNPMVGAVLVYQDRIIGEGWHQCYGKAHAEVNCIASVSPGDQHLIRSATMYVSLEPCAHVGKTPPCADLIIRHQVPAVVVGCRDPFKEVDGKGIGKLEAAGVKVKVGVLEKECNELNRRFFLFHAKKRPYIILKWAQTADGFIAGASDERLMISNAYSNRLVHRWRSEEAAILVGTGTAAKDDPELSTRRWPGPSPLRIVIDRRLELPLSLKLFNGAIRTIVFNTMRQEEINNVLFYKLDDQNNLLPQILQALYEQHVQSVLVEGGAQLLQSFIDAGLWDEARVICSEQLMIREGLPAPVLVHQKIIRQRSLQGDTITYYTRDTTDELSLSTSTNQS